MRSSQKWKISMEIGTGVFIVGGRDCSRGITLGLFRLLEIYLLVTGKRAGRCGASEGLESAGSYGIDLILGIEWAASPELVDMQDGRCRTWSAEFGEVAVAVAVLPEVLESGAVRLVAMGCQEKQMQCKMDDATMNESLIKTT